MKKTKLFTLALVLGLLAGCGDSDSQKGDNNKSGDKVVLKGKADSSSKSGNAPQEEESKEVKLLLNLVSSLTFKEDGSVDIENTKFDIAKTQKRDYCSDGETLEPGWEGGYDANGQKEGVWTEYEGSCAKKRTNIINMKQAYKNGVLLNEIEFRYLKFKNSRDCSDIGDMYGRPVPCATDDKSMQVEPLIVPTKTLYYGTIEGNEHLGKVLYFKTIKIRNNFFFPKSVYYKSSYKYESISIVINGSEPTGYAKMIGAKKKLYETSPVDTKCYYVDGKMYIHSTRKVGPYSSYAALLKQADERGEDSIFESSKTQEWHLKSGNLVVDNDKFDEYNDGCSTLFFQNAVKDK